MRKVALEIVAFAPNRDRNATLERLEHEEPVDFAVAKANKIFWKIKQGYMIGFGPEAAETGSKYTKRALPY